jgi:hypothetical protein
VPDSSITSHAWKRQVATVHGSSSVSLAAQSVSAVHSGGVDGEHPMPMQVGEVSSVPGSWKHAVVEVATAVRTVRAASLAWWVTRGR